MDEDTQLARRARLLPVSNRIKSFWLTEPDRELQHARTTTELPKKADVVIIGSGLSGAMISHYLYKALTDVNKPNVVMLEAAETCGGASARNGGHCKPVTYLAFEERCQKHGPEVANHMYDFESSHLQRYADIVNDEGIDCDLHATRAFDVFSLPDEAEASKTSFRKRLAMFPDSMKKYDIREHADPAELEALTGIKGGHWGASYPAGHLWPYKLATGLIHRSLSQGMNLQTSTPVLDVKASGNNHTVVTPRGSIEAKTVIVATNAYTAGVLPEFLDRIVPIRGTACSITPPPSHSPGGSPGPFRYTYGMRHGPGQSDYMIPRQGRGRVPGIGDTSLILGGAKGCFQNDLSVWYDNVNDDEELPGVRSYFENYMGKYFVGWKGANARGNVDRVWTGVLGYSSDLLPYVGEHPSRRGLFVSAGFTGHGMPRIPACSQVVAGLAAAHLQGSNSTVTTHLMSLIPKPYRLTQKRLDNQNNLIQAALGYDPAGKIAPVDEIEMLRDNVKSKL